MSRRKGELSTFQIDRDWPQQVAIPAMVVQQRFTEILALCSELSVAPRQPGYRRDDQEFIVYCFRRESDAETFARAFGGDRMTSDARPRWPARPSPSELRARRRSGP